MTWLQWGLISALLQLIVIPENIFSRTIQIDTQDCFGLPEKPIGVSGALVTHSKSSGRTLCFFQPADAAQYTSLYATILSLDRQFGGCPTVTINEFSSVREALIDENDPNLRVPMIVPADPKLIFSANCTDYQKKIKVIAKTSSPGLKLQLLFDPIQSEATDLKFQFVLTSFVLGPSFNCPTETFRCWEARSDCIPESLTCDGIFNCPDGSDENTYLCTGRINGIPIPLFAIIIVVSFIGLVLIVLTIVFVLRRRKKKSKQEEQTWVDMTIRTPALQQQQPLLTQKTWPQNEPISA